MAETIISPGQIDSGDYYHSFEVSGENGEIECQGRVNIEGDRLKFDVTFNGGGYSYSATLAKKMETTLSNIRIATKYAGIKGKSLDNFMSEVTNSVIEQIYADIDEGRKRQSEENDKALRSFGDAKSKTVGDYTAIFDNLRPIHPALDYNPDDKIILAVPIHTTDRENRQSLSPWIITSDHDFFVANEDQFLNHGMFAKVPQSLSDQRWNSESLYQFIDGMNTLVNPYEVYRSIKEKFDWYIDFVGTGNVSTLCALYVIGTYFFFLFDYYPYLKIGGVQHVGKSKTGTLLATMAFNGDIFANSSAPAIYRAAEDTRATMVIDEAEGLAYKSEERLAYFQILNSGFQADGKAHKVDKDTMRVERFSTYSPKVIIAIGGLDEVLSERAFEIILQMSDNEELKAREVRTKSAEFQPTRDSLYLLLMQSWKEVREIGESLNQSPIEGIGGRIWNLAKPLITIARFIDRYAPEGERVIEKEISDYIKGEAERKAAAFQETKASTVLHALYEEIRNKMNVQDSNGENHQWSVKLVGLRKAILRMEVLPDDYEGWKSKEITRILRNLHMYNAPSRTGRGYEFRVSMKEVKAQAQRYKIELEPREGEKEKDEGQEKAPSSLFYYSKSDGENEHDEDNERREESVEGDKGIILETHGSEREENQAVFSSSASQIPSSHSSTSPSSPSAILPSDSIDDQETPEYRREASD